MKLVAIGDIHGRDIWKKIVEAESDADKIIFIGDYFDSKENINGNAQLDNFNEIIRMKADNPDKFVILTGNHDLHYLSNLNQKYSGYQPVYSLAFEDKIQKAIDKRLMQMCYLHDNYLFSHAGITKTWVEQTNLDLKPIMNQELVDNINDMLVYKPSVFKFSKGETLDAHGDDITQGPTWVRPYSLMLDMVIGVTYIVGHTSVGGIFIESEYENIINIDCLGFTNEYLVIEDNKPYVKKLN